MQSLFWTGRLVSRALWNSISNYSANSGATTEAPAAASTTSICAKKFPRLLSAVSGIPKDLKNAKLTKGKFGEDAWFSAKWKTAEVIGVADGVGGWREYGIDAGEFSSSLMSNCERFVTSGRFDATDPISLLACGYYELFESKQQILGSSTACLVMLNREQSTVYTANIGDSGFVIVRQGKVVHKSDEQQHYFNTPYQLSMPPPNKTISVLTDSPESAERSQFKVEDGDVILLATDGVFDNVPQHMLLTELKSLHGVTDLLKIQNVANTIALMARSLAFDQNFLSPFTKAARKNGIHTSGGKPDDITVLLATVAFT